MLLEACLPVFLSVESVVGWCGSVVWFCCCRCEVLPVVGSMIPVGCNVFRGCIGFCVQPCSDVVWSSETPLVVVARLSFDVPGVVCAARFLWFWMLTEGSSTSGLVVSDALLEDLHGIFDVLT